MSDNKPLANVDIIYLLIPIAVVLVIVGLAAFFWAVKNDQFEDLDGPAHSILFDDDPTPSAPGSIEPEKQQKAPGENNPDA